TKIDSGGPIERFRNLLEQLKNVPADDCGWTGPSETAEFDPILKRVEDELFDQADKVVSAALNASSTKPLDAAKDALERMRAIGIQINSGWPEERRFGYELIDLGPTLAVNYRFRSRAAFSVFGFTERGIPPPQNSITDWNAFGHNENRWGEHNSD